MSLQKSNFFVPQVSQMLKREPSGAFVVEHDISHSGDLPVSRDGDGWQRRFCQDGRVHRD